VVRLVFLQLIGTKLVADGGVDFAYGNSVNRVDVLKGVRDTFDNVDFPSVVPSTSRVGADSPPSWPDTANDRHVGSVKNEYTNRDGGLWVTVGILTEALQDVGRQAHIGLWHWGAHSPVY
jgi:hypothetical protein